MRDFSDIEKAIFNFFEANSASVEIISEDNIYKVFHIVHPLFKNLREEFKEEIMFNMNRES